MAAAQVVPTFDPSEGSQAQRGDARPGAAFDELELVGPEPAFTHRVVPTLCAPRQALDHVMLGEQGPKVTRRVLGCDPRSE